MPALAADVVRLRDRAAQSRARRRGDDARASRGRAGLLLVAPVRRRRGAPGRTCRAGARGSPRPTRRPTCSRACGRARCRRCTRRCRDRRTCRSPAATRRPAPSQSLTSSPLTTASPPAATISSTTSCARRLVGAVPVQRRAEVVHDDLGALGRERERVRAAEAAPAAGHDHHAPVADPHGSIPRCPVDVAVPLVLRRVRAWRRRPRRARRCCRSAVSSTWRASRSAARRPPT